MSSLKRTEEVDSLLQAAKIRLIMQLRRNGVTDTKTLGAIEAVPRERFVTEQFLEHAYDDRALPIESDQTISQPTIVGLMTQSLELGDRMTVLEIGTGSGYQTAILSKLARRVHTIERHERLFKIANQRFEELGLRNVTTHLGDGSKGWSHAAPYDRIIVTACAFGEPPSALLSQLADDGIMVIPVEEDHEQTLYRIHKEGETFVKLALCRVQFVPLVSE